MEIMNYEALGNRIKAYRKKNGGMTQKQLAERAGISMSFLGNIERGNKKASIDTLVAIANALTVSTDVLLQDSLAQDPLGLGDDLTDRQKDLIRDFTQMLREKEY